MYKGLLNAGTNRFVESFWCFLGRPGKARGTRVFAASNGSYASTYHQKWYDYRNGVCACADVNTANLEGIFRVSGSKSSVDTLRETIDQGMS